ncbi:hypothetical protein CYG49_00055 [Candidatus Saccharibacteria bacterium]|nr:MAG: hypothetical protein CYG49_00055 [Candidatus Saccharibacteria bacterium]
MRGLLPRLLVESVQLGPLPEDLVGLVDRVDDAQLGVDQGLGQQRRDGLVRQRSVELHLQRDPEGRAVDDVLNAVLGRADEVAPDRAFCDGLSVKRRDCLHPESTDDVAADRVDHTAELVVLQHGEQRAPALDLHRDGAEREPGGIGTLHSCSPVLFGVHPDGAVRVYR